MDNICSTLGFMVTGNGNILYNGRIYSRPVGNSNSSCNHKADTGKKPCVISAIDETQKTQPGLEFNMNPKPDLERKD